jgi:hypothetical protein
VFLVRGRRITEAVGALAGLALVVLVFLPWWAFDPASVQAAPDVGRAGVLIDLYLAPDVSAWDGLRNGAIIWIVTGVLGAALVLAPRFGLSVRSLRRVRIAVLSAALVSLAIALVRLADPPFAAYQPTAAAYAGTVVIATVVICAALGLRRA